MEPMSDCEDFRRALDRARDGAASPGPMPAETEREARAHVASCADCRSAAAVMDAVAARLRERGGPADAPAPARLREAVMARVHKGEAAILELHPFLRRAAVAAAAVFLAATAASFWQATRVRGPEAVEAGLTRDDVVALIVRLHVAPGR
jgi:hypothetical protein